jgi:hypothetical protein
MTKRLNRNIILQYYYLDKGIFTVKFLFISGRKFLFSLCIILGLNSASQISAICENTDELISELSKQELTPEIEKCQKVLAEITQLLREFVHDLQNNKKLNHYLKELAKFTKELGEMAKHNHEAYRTVHGNLHKRLYELHKGFHTFIAVIKANESSPGKIGAELMKRPELKNLIPDAAGWTLINIFPALNIRCKK